MKTGNHPADTFARTNRQGPSSVRQWLGYIASCAINARLRSATTREAISKWVDLANQHPSLLADVDDTVRVPTEYGFSIHCSRRSGIGQTLISEGRWEGLLSRTLLVGLSAGDLAIDVGANIGYDTLLMSKAVGPAGRVIAFEPELQNLALLLTNVASLVDSNVVVQSLALSDVAAMADIAVSDAYHRGRPNLRPGQSGATQSILAARLDQLLQGIDLKRIAFLKMDVEGYEFKALQGMEGLIDRIDRITCEINHDFLAQCGTSAKQIFDYLAAHGFHSYCADSVSNGQWVAAGHGYQISASTDTHFDALFLRQGDESLTSMIASGA